MYVVVITRNKSIAVTTLHSLMNMKMYALHRNEHIEVVYTETLAHLPKLVKSGERIMWFEYGTNLDNETIAKIFNPMEKDVRVIVYPSVTEGVDWEMFKKKTVEGSKEPIYQRGLHFDTEVTKKIAGTELWDVQSTSARVWLMDSKQIDKKLKSSQKNLSCESYESLFSQLKALNIRVAALPSAIVIRHYTYECLGNILEMPGLTMAN